MKHILAAGAVIYREQNNRREVAAIHRPRYDDWTLPKGKCLPNEPLSVCAVREVAEETGLIVKLDTPLNQVEYLFGTKKKTVSYWRAQVIVENNFVVTNEVDQLRWLDIATDLDLLTRQPDRDLVQQAIALPTTTAVVITCPRKKIEDRNSDDYISKITAIVSSYQATQLYTFPKDRCRQLLSNIASPLTEISSSDIKSLLAQASLSNQPITLAIRRKIWDGVAAKLGIATNDIRNDGIAVAHLDEHQTIIAVEYPDLFYGAAKVSAEQRKRRYDEEI